METELKLKIETILNWNIRLRILKYDVDQDENNFNDLDHYIALIWGFKLL